LRRKVTAIAASDPEVVVIGNPGYLPQIRPSLRAVRPTIRSANPPALLDERLAAETSG
jgi:hypothetical protein